MKKAIVAGATGFIGKWVVRELISQGVEVTIIVRDSHRKESLFENKVKIVYCEMSDYRYLPELIQDRNFDVIYDFAWDGVSGDKLKNEEIQIKNMKATLDLIGILPQIGCKKFVGSGSLHEIESYYEMNENKTISNLGYMYKASKMAAHWMGKAKAGSLGIEFFWPIVVNAYGEGEKSKRLINSIIRSILAGESPALSAGKQYYDFLHIVDVANAFYLIGEKGVNGTNYILGSGKPKPLREYLEIVGNVTNEINHSDIELGFGKITTNVVSLPKETFDISALVKDTGFKPTIDFETGISRTINWIIENS